MKVVISGGAGVVGAVLLRHFTSNHKVVILSRHPAELSVARTVPWDGKTLGPWTTEIDGADVVINLAGRSVNCRYNDENLKEMMDSRVDSTWVVGRAISIASKPPRVWLQASTATIYAHRFDAPNDEAAGIIGGGEPGAPKLWDASIDIAKAWEATLAEAETPATRKVAMRSAMIMSCDRGSVFDRLRGLAKMGLLGRFGNGCQFVSRVHEMDFCKAVDFLIDREDLDGPINICSPEPLPQWEFARILRRALKAPLGFPTPEWLLEIGTWLLGTESELVLKSRRVVPARLLNAGFAFQFPHWTDAAAELVKRDKPVTSM